MANEVATGSGTAGIRPPVLFFLHGFPELWYSWRHQMLAVSAVGYRAIAPDLRGFGDSDTPPSALHGFSELWYSWRHQMLAVSAVGYRVIAPDLCGFGDSNAHPSASSYTAFHVVGDLVDLLDQLSLHQPLFIGHD